MRARLRAAEDVSASDYLRLLRERETMKVAAGKALAAFDKIRWICGGLQKEGGLGDLLDHAQGVRKAYVIGREAAAFAVPCDQYGQRVEACIRFKPGRSADVEDLLAHCVAHLGKFKSPDHLHVLDDLPKGPSGKVQRLKLYSMVHGGDS